MAEDTGMTEEEMDDSVKKVSDNIDKYIKETGRAGVGVAYAIFIRAAGELSNVLSAKDVVVGAEMAAETLRTFLEDAERECKSEDIEDIEETLGNVVTEAESCARELSEYVKRTGRRGVSEAYFAISKVSKCLPDDDISVDDVVIALEMAAKHDRGFLDLMK